MASGQGGTEYIVLLGAVLVIALIAVSLLMFYPGTSGDASKSQSDLYWRTTASPVAVLEAHGVTRYHSQGSYPETVILVLKNRMPETIYLDGIVIGGSGSDRIYSGTQETYDVLGHLNIGGPDECIPPCGIVMPPGREIKVQAFGLAGLCNYDYTMGSDSVNSVRKSAEATVRIDYSANGIQKSQIGTQKLWIICDDFWLCSAASECSAKYGASAPDCEPPGEGACVMTGE